MLLVSQPFPRYCTVTNSREHTLVKETHHWTASHYPTLLPPSFSAHPCEDTPSSPPLVSSLSVYFFFLVPVFLRPVSQDRVWQERPLTGDLFGSRSHQCQSKWGEWVDRSAKCLLCFPVFPLSSLWRSCFCFIWSLFTWNFFVLTISPVTARTRLDEFLVCRVNIPGPCKVGKKKNPIHVRYHFIFYLYTNQTFERCLPPQKEASDLTRSPRGWYPNLIQAGVEIGEFAAWVWINRAYEGIWGGGFSALAEKPEFL